MITLEEFTQLLESIGVTCDACIYTGILFIPKPGRSLGIILPLVAFTPLNKSLFMRILPSRSTQSARELKCAAADMAQEVSVIHPNIIFRFSCLARIIIL